MKKILSLAMIMALILVIGLLVGCGSSANFEVNVHYRFPTLQEEYTAEPAILHNLQEVDKYINILADTVWMNNPPYDGAPLRSGRERYEEIFAEFDDVFFGDRALVAFTFVCRHLRTPHTASINKSSGEIVLQEMVGGSMFTMNTYWLIVFEIPNENLPDRFTVTRTFTLNVPRR